MEDGAQENVVLVETPALKKEAAAPATGGGWGGWGGWGTSALSVLSDLQKAAVDVADEISKNAVAAAQGAAKGVAELQKSVADNIDLDVKETSLPKEDAVPNEEAEKVSYEEEDIPLTPQDKLRRSALEKLEGASKDTFLGQGLKAFDDSVETITSGAFQAFGNAWKGSVTLVQKLEHSAENLAGTIQQGSLSQKAGSLVESSKAFTVRGIKVLEYVGKETLDMIAAETGIELEKDSPKARQVDGDDEGYNEDVTFDRCFYIYGGPEHLEELESLSNHYTLLCNRARAKLAGEAKVSFDGTLKELQHTLSLSGESDDGANKGKKVEAELANSGNELTSLRDSSISKAAEMAAGFTGALGGLVVKEVVKKTTDRLDAIKAEGVHRLSELCAVCISHLVVLGKSVLITSTEESEKKDSVPEEFEWPQDCLAKAALIRARARAMAGDMEAVSDSFMTCIGDVTAAFQAAIKNELAVAKEEGGEGMREGLLKESSIEDKAQAVCSDIENDGSAAIEKIQDGLKHLIYVVLSTSLSS